MPWRLLDLATQLDCDLSVDDEVALIAVAVPVVWRPADTRRHERGDDRATLAAVEELSLVSAFERCVCGIPVDRPDEVHSLLLLRWGRRTTRDASPPAASDRERRPSCRQCV